MTRVEPCVFMRGRSTSRTVVPIDLEIEATCRCNNAARRQREQDIDTSPPLSPNHVQMDGEPARRVTLEDFSHTTTPEFFTSITNLYSLLLSVYSLKMKTQNN